MQVRNLAKVTADKGPWITHPESDIWAECPL